MFPKQFGFTPVLRTDSSFTQKMMAIAVPACYISIFTAPKNQKKDNILGREAMPSPTFFL
jgi:hypothetical protein